MTDQEKLDFAADLQAKGDVLNEEAQALYRAASRFRDEVAQSRSGYSVGDVIEKGDGGYLDGRFVITEVGAGSGDGVKIFAAKLKRDGSRANLKPVQIWSIDRYRKVGVESAENNT